MRRKKNPCEAIFPVCVLSSFFLLLSSSSPKPKSGGHSIIKKCSGSGSMRDWKSIKFWGIPCNLAFQKKYLLAQMKKDVFSSQKRGSPRHRIVGGRRLAPCRSWWAVDLFGGTFLNLFGDFWEILGDLFWTCFVNIRTFCEPLWTCLPDHQFSSNLGTNNEIWRSLSRNSIFWWILAS